MITWPNWVDLLIITFVVRGGYVGYCRGLLTECLGVAGVLLLSVLCVNWTSLAASVVQPLVPWFSHTTLLFAVFWLLLIGLSLAWRVVMRAAASVVKWERVHWFLQSLGLILGAARGGWWAGLIVLSLTTSGFQYLQQSAQERSLLGPHLASVSREGLLAITDRFPGTGYRLKTLVPPARPAPR